FWDSNARQPLHHQSIEVKQGDVKQATSHANEMQASQNARIAQYMGVSKDSIVVFNSLSWDRKEMVKMNVPETLKEITHFEIKDLSTGEVMPSQVISNHDGSTSVWFMA